MKRSLKAIRLIWVFYRNYCWISLAISLCCAAWLWKAGYKDDAFFFIFWFKVTTLGLIFYFIGQYKKKEFYYFQNLGVSKNTLWITTLVFDFVLFIALLIITNRLR